MSEFQSLVLKLLLDNVDCLPPKCSIENEEDPYNVIGWTILLALAATLFGRLILFNLSFKVGLHTAIRFMAKMCLVSNF